MSTIEVIDFIARVVLIVIVLVGWARLNELESAVLALEQARLVLRETITWQQSHLHLLAGDTAKLSARVDLGPRLYGQLIDTLKDCVGENDDDDDHWRPLLAGILRRFRVTPEGRRRLAQRVEWRIEHSMRLGTAVAHVQLRPIPFVWPPRGEA